MVRSFISVATIQLNVVNRMDVIEAAYGLICFMACFLLYLASICKFNLRKVYIASLSCDEEYIHLFIPENLLDLGCGSRQILLLKVIC